MNSARVHWMERAYEAIRTGLLPEAPPLAKVCLAYSFPTCRAREGKRTIAGQWVGAPVKGSEAGSLILVHPRQWTSAMAVLHVLAHEMVHAATPGAGHKAAFWKMARGIGLEGKPTCTEPGESFCRWAKAALAELPAFDPDWLMIYGANAKKQTTRMRLYVCAECGQKLRAATDDLQAVHAPCEAPFVLQGERKLDEPAEAA